MFIETHFLSNNCSEVFFYSDTFNIFSQTHHDTDLKSSHCKTKLNYK